MPDDVAEEKVKALEALGATVERVRPASIVDKKQVCLSLANLLFKISDLLCDSVCREHATSRRGTKPLTNLEPCKATSQQIWPIRQYRRKRSDLKSSPSSYFPLAFQLSSCLIDIDAR